MTEANQDIRLERGLVIPGGELRWTFGPSGGPGGQHANRAHTRAELRLDVAGSAAFDSEARARVLRNLAPRLRDGSLTVIVDEQRSQWRNRQLARRRLKELLDDALRPDPPSRRATRPSRGVVQRRKEAKRRRSRTKQLRARPDDE